MRDPRCGSAGELPDARLVSASAERNRGPILELLATELPSTGAVLEIASGTGQHVVHFARALADLDWQPSDPDAGARASIEAWRRHEALANVLAPLALDVRDAAWPVERHDAIVCINLLHIAPWAATVALFERARGLLRERGIVYLYGPYSLGGRHTAASNAEFDAALRARDADWGVRDLEQVAATARQCGFRLARVFSMPANNFSLVFRRVDTPASRTTQ